MQLTQTLLILTMLAGLLGGRGNVASSSETNPPQASILMQSSSDLIFTDAFDAGDLSAWSSSATDGGDLSASGSAALVGVMGLQAVIDDNNSIYLTDDLPAAEPRYRARFYFDPNSISMASGNAHFIFTGFKGTSTAILRVELRQSSGNYELRARLLNDGTTWINTNWFIISDTSHCVELDWRAATAAGANNGGLTLWIDDIQRSVMNNVDNDTRRIDRIRLGAVGGIDSGTRGIYYFDAFESRRQTYIGPTGSVLTPPPTPTNPQTSTATPTTLPTQTAILPTATNSPLPIPTSTPTATVPSAGNVRFVYTASSEDFANPERGFMKQISVFPDQAFDLSKVKALQPSDSLVWVYFRLDNYRDRLLDQNGLNIIRSIFTTARSKGLKLVIRFVYNPGPGATSDPNLATPDAPIDLVLQHIAQLKPILVENADVIAAVQAGFVGHWGEWHSTKYLHPLEYRRTIVNALLAALPADRMLQLRYPRHKEILYPGTLTSQEAFSGTDRSRVGLHNDCFLRDDADANTYGSSSPQLPKLASTYCDGQNEIACWKEFSAHEGNFTPIGGETCQLNPPRTDCPNALQELEMLHWSFIHSGYQKDVLNSWVSGGCMNTIRLRLGYRFVLKEASIPSSVRPGSALNLSVHLSNDGFAAMYNPHLVYLVLLGSSSRYEIPLANVDPRRWAPGQEHSLDLSVNLPANVAPGTYRLALWLPDAYASLRNSPAYSVRFANTGVWDAATGVNILAPNFVVNP